jgi:hypothetical protein
VVHAIIQYVKKARPALLYFQAAEPNRRALYARMIQRVLPSLPGWASMTVGNGEFGIYNKRAVKSAMGTEVSEATEHSNPTADKIFFARSKIAPKAWRYDHVGFITQDGRQIQMSGHRDNDVYVTDTVSDDPEFPEQHIKIVSLPKPVSVPTTNTVGAENCGTFVANVLKANGIKGIDTHKLYKIFKQPREQGMDEEVTRQMSQGGLRASYQAKYNQPMSEDYLDEARS